MVCVLRCTLTALRGERCSACFNLPQVVKKKVKKEGGEKGDQSSGDAKGGRGSGEKGAEGKEAKVKVTSSGDEKPAGKLAMLVNTPQYCA